MSRVLLIGIDYYFASNTLNSCMADVMMLRDVWTDGCRENEFNQTIVVKTQRRIAKSYRSA